MLFGFEGVLPAYLSDYYVIGDQLFHVCLGCLRVQYILGVFLERRDEFCNDWGITLLVIILIKEILQLFIDSFVQFFYFHNGRK